LSTSKIIGIVIGVVILVSLFSIWFYPSLQDYMTENVSWNGGNRITEEFNITPLDEFTALPEVPAGTAVISLPYIAYSDNEAAEVKSYIESGGTLIIMDDFGRANKLLEYLGVSARFNGHTVMDPLFCYRSQVMPVVSDLDASLKESGINSLTLNHPSLLENTAGWKVLARSSVTSYCDENENGTWDKGEATGPFVIAAESTMGKGKIVLISDPSILINSMLDKSDNRKLVGYLAGRYGESGTVFLDRVHLEKSPLDAARKSLISTRQTVSHPYILTIIVLILFVIITGYIYKRGLIIG